MAPHGVLPELLGMEKIVSEDAVPVKPPVRTPQESEAHASSCSSQSQYRHPCRNTAHAGIRPATGQTHEADRVMTVVAYTAATISGVLVYALATSRVLVHGETREFFR